MNILFRHTLNCVRHNPVQSVIVVISTAMITACILVCLCISSLFEQLAGLRANSMYAGADLYIYSLSTHAEEAADYAADHADETEAVLFTNERDIAIMSESNTVRGYMIRVEDIAEFNSLTSATVLTSCENGTEHPSAHVSAAFAKATGVSLGDTFSVATGETFTVTGIADNTGRYYNGTNVVFVCASDSFTPTRMYVYLAPDAAHGEGTALLDRWEKDLGDIAGETYIRAEAQSALDEAASSVEESMTLMSIAALAIAFIMCALLFASFSVMVRGRVNELVKFKAAGATPAQSAGILLFEAALYAIVGGLIGLAFGELLLDYVSGMLTENIVSGSVVAEGWKYPVAVLIGAGCALAACVIPAFKMSFRSIRRLLGGSERFTPSLHPAVAAVVTVLTAALSLALFFVPRTALVPVAIATLLLMVLWLLTVMPKLLKGMCAVTGKFSRGGVSSIAAHAAPRSIAVTSTFIMLAALIMFINLGTGILNSVEYTSTPNSSRYNSDFIVTLAGDRKENTESELDFCLSVDGVTAGSAADIYSTFILCDENGNRIMTREDSSALYNMIYAVDDGDDMTFFTTSLDPAVIRAFDEAEHPIVLSSYIAYKYDIAPGDVLTLLSPDRGDGAQLSLTKFTVVGIDETVTSWDNIAFVRRDSVLFEGGFSPVRTVLLYLNGDSRKFPAIREEIDASNRRIYTRDGYYPAEGADRLDTTRLVSAFSLVVYVIAAVGLVNLILVTAGERRRELDCLRLAGMTQKDALRYILTETALLAAGGTAAGLLLSVVANRATVAFAQIINKYVLPVTFPASLPVIAAVGCGIFVFFWAVSHIVAFKEVSSPRYRTRDDRMLRSS